MWGATTPPLPYLTIHLSKIVLELLVEKMSDTEKYSNQDKLKKIGTEFLDIESSDPIGQGKALEEFME